MWDLRLLGFSCYSPPHQETLNLHDVKPRMVLGQSSMTMACVRSVSPASVFRSLFLLLFSCPHISQIFWGPAVCNAANESGWLGQATFVADSSRIDYLVLCLSGVGEGRGDSFPLPLGKILFLPSPAVGFSPFHRGRLLAPSRGRGRILLGRLSYNSPGGNICPFP